MNLKKTVLSLFAATAIIGSMFAPAFAENTINQSGDSKSEVEESGAFVFSFGANVTFDNALVSSTTGDTVGLSDSNHRVMYVSDERTSSPGYVLQMTATDLTKQGDSSKTISSSYLSVRNGGGNGGGPGGVHNSCLHSSAPAPVGGNSFQTHTWNLSQTNYTPIGGGVTLITAGAGRGCDYLDGAGGRFQYNMQWQLEIPAGIATGIYEGDITISDIQEP